MPTYLTGSCLCGGVRFELEQPARFCAHCHCANCRRAHGAAFVTFAGFVDDQCRIVAGEDLLTHYRTNTDATRSFCSRCGSTLFYSGPRWAGEIHVARANIEGDQVLRPQAHAYADRHPDWHEITDDLPRFGGKTGGERLT